jgi:hypothetical protein
MLSSPKETTPSQLTSTQKKVLGGAIVAAATIITLGFLWSAVSRLNKDMEAVHKTPTKEN